MWKTDPGRNVLYTYGIKCSTEEEGSTGNELTAKKINSNGIQYSISHTRFQAMQQICVTEF